MGHMQTGARLTCAGCGTQVMVVKAPSAAPSCCGVPLAGPATGKEGGDGERRR
jgi:hypothetical protein